MNPCLVPAGDGAFYLDAHCSHSAGDFSALIELDATEIAVYEASGHGHGHGHLDRPAHDIR